jgi:hypothetical protein
MRGKGEMSLKAIANAVGGSYDAVKNLVTKMHGDEALWRTRYGKYVLPEKEIDWQTKGQTNVLEGPWPPGI